MPNPNPKLENLKSYKPGEKRAAENGSKGGKARGRSIKCILQDFMDMEPSSIFKLTDEEKEVAKTLKKQGLASTKDLIYWKMTQKAQKGDLNAMKMLEQHLGEDPGKLIKLGGAEDLPPVQVDSLVQMSVEQLEELSHKLAKAVDEC